MSYLKMVQQIKNNRLAPIMLLYGTETYFIHELKKQITHQLLPAEEREHVSVYDLEELPIQDIITDAETYSLFSASKLIFVYNPVFLLARAPKLAIEHNMNALEQYLREPAEHSTIVFIAPYEKIDNRKKITKLIKKNGLVAECNPIRDYEVNKWIKMLADELNIKITEEALQKLGIEVGTNLHIIQQELIKLSTYVGEKGEVTADIVDRLISRSLNQSALRLADAVMEKNLREALRIYKDLEKMNEEVIAIIGLLAFQFRMLLQVKLLKQKGYSQSQIQKSVQAHPYVIKVAYEREKRYSVQRLMKMLDQLAETDANIKHGKMEKQIAFELLLHHLTNE